ncbi:MAG: deoxyguanosinetriphosphate triphosphohydrolase [Bacillota bacterium]
MDETQRTLLELEEKALAPWAARSTSSRGRRYPVPGESDDPRPPYVRDRDRIVHSTAFRRLQHKTQVFVLHEGDFYRTRLTHTLEVAQIGRALAAMLRANPTLAEAIALGHDLGHPPFGHSGEEELRELMRDHGGFEHNLQALRIVDELEERYAHHPGLNLTWETREGIARHETFYDRPGTLDEFSCWRQPGIEAQICSVADTIAYCTHDLQDALTVGFIEERELGGRLAIWHEAEEAAGVRAGVPRLEERPVAAREVRQRMVVRALIDRLIRDVAAESLRRLEALSPASPDEVRRQQGPLVGFSDRVRHEVEQIQRLLYERMYYDPRTRRMSVKGRLIIRRLFELFEREPSVLPRKTQERLALASDRRRVLCDFVAGMTDRYAMDLYEALFEPYERSLGTQT